MWYIFSTLLSHIVYIVSSEFLLVHHTDSVVHPLQMLKPTALITILQSTVVVDSVQKLAANLSRRTIREQWTFLTGINKTNPKQKTD